MTDFYYAAQELRGVLLLSGRERVPFLNALISQGVEKTAGGERAIYSALLNAQGRYLHDFFVAPLGDALLIECEAARVADLLQRLTRYRLRSQVSLADAGPQYASYILWGDGIFEALGLPKVRGALRMWEGGAVFVDPRLQRLGARAILPRLSAADSLAKLPLAAGDIGEWQRLRLSEGVPEGSCDLPVEKAILLENGFDELQGIDWQKGCYIGQELTARTKYRGLVRKRLLPIRVEAGPAPEVGSALLTDNQGSDGQEAGEIRSLYPKLGLGLALIRLESLPLALKEGLRSGDARLTTWVPKWMELPKLDTS